MTDQHTPPSMGAPIERIDGRAKVTGAAPYAYDQPVQDPLYLHAVQATIAKGRVTGIDVSDAEKVDGVVAIITSDNAFRLTDIDDPELLVLQSNEVAFRGQVIGGVVAVSPEIACEAADLLHITYAEEQHHAEMDPERGDLIAPEKLDGNAATDTSEGDVDAALAGAVVTVEQTYTTPLEHNNPMEPHTTIAQWDDGRLVLHTSTQGVHVVRSAMAPLFGLDENDVRVVSPYVGGGFGSKGKPHAPAVLAALAARAVPGRPVKLALTRRQMFELVGYRSETISTVRLGADSDGQLCAISHEAIGRTSTVVGFTEQTAIPTRTMYAAPNRLTTHRYARLDVPIPFWMRAPGECPGMFGPELAMDELAEACGIDPIELRLRNDTDTDPDTGKPFTHRDLAGCLREGVRRFGWHDRDPRPGVRRDGPWLVGTGVASSTYPANTMPGSRVRIRHTDGAYVVQIGAADIGTGTWTALTQIAADALDCPTGHVLLEIGDTDLPNATVEGGSSGISSWGSAIVAAVEAFRKQHGDNPTEGAMAEAEAPEDAAAEQFAAHSFGAQFAEILVHRDTGEIRVPRMLGVFSVGRIVNPRTARSQLIGGMTMGLSMALFEHSVMDPRFGHIVNHDFAEYHIAGHADVADIEAVWLDECDPRTNPMGTRGVGEIGIVGAAAAIANAAYHATGVRVRDLPITPDRFVGALAR
ncbi:MAG TPA: xanthine dehydrogenase family protein molybdopterin-binding subunit [Flexivirga sp.]|uniref:xanthine dehydrogenase family protein molybdopterin-binding subunit n=1 Tax=Flexivirga sp. TaxID=1962927 RepID=UPI002C626D9E|nr:xanthine dehydrogenase family protein molybdopterin-binding subunit [Flexivirga sp.]HWC21734.1 xanthine dehydrogenase family protein molybdopterin-binding subunit [Flexivirga sp.]